ncbi:ThuA domain-containing protein [Akkermansiaceae bacterium]|nr:ThuA domain-containing protein [Akkermansiaceae bacterium]
MKHLLLFLALLQVAAAAEPLRVFIRSGPKTHRPGCHDYPAFLRDWTALLNERGAKATGGNDFPTKEQLAETDVVILHASEAGNIDGENRKNFEAYLERGGGVVAIHGGAVSRDHGWYKQVIGGSWNFAQTKFLEGQMSLYFTDIENPITQGVSNFDLDDEIYYDMEILPEAKILAAAYTPKAKDGKVGKDNRVNVYDIQPQMWTYETGNRRAFVCIPGHVYANFSHNSIESVLLRGIAWAGKMDDADALLADREKTRSALRYPVGGPTRPEEAAAKIELHPEFGISLVAAEPLINKAMNLDWDEKGRLWVVESPEYPNGLRKTNTDVWKDSGSIAAGAYDREPTDRISILSDGDGDGRMDQKKVFADKLELATGFVLHRNGVIAAAAPDIWFLEDTDGDEVADKRTKLYTGLGNGDTHAVINNLRWGLDGWIYATHGYSAGNVKCLGAPEKPPVNIGSGVVRFKPDGTEIEMYSSKRGNTWGLCMGTDGQVFWTQPTSGVVFFHTVLPESVLQKGKLPGTESFHGMVAGQRTYPLMDWQQAAYRQIDWVGSYTAAAGCAVYEGGAWPEKWNLSYFTGEPTINIVSHYFVRPDGITYTAEKEKGREETEFIRSSDLWFRPIDTRIGPDGALYVIDFYNQAVIHNDTRGPKHNPANAAVRPDRDHYFGRIWRIQHKQAKKIGVPVIDKGSPDSVKAALGSPNGHTRQTAMRLLREAGNPPQAKTGSEAMATYGKFRNPESAEDRKQLIAAFSEAKDNWTKSALIAAASENPVAVITDCLGSSAPGNTEQLAGNLVRSALSGDSPQHVSELIQAVAGSVTAEGSSLRATILQEIVAAKTGKVALDSPLESSLVKLLEDPGTSSAAISLIKRFDESGELDAAVKKRVAQLVADLSGESATEAERIAAAKSLISIGNKEALDSTMAMVRDAKATASPMNLAIISAYADSPEVVKLALAFAQIAEPLRIAAFEGIVKHPGATLKLLEEIEGGRMQVGELSPSDISRLFSHPDGKVLGKARQMNDKLRPGLREKNEIIASLLPELSKPADVGNGKAVFTAACAVCHQFGDLGTSQVGPALTGMGTHAPAELLGHIVNPNLEVDPSFWQWNITTNDGKSIAGTVTSENATTVAIRNQGGEMEIRKSDIRIRENTRRSLMPEGLEGLGAKNIRDIIAYMGAADRARLGTEEKKEAAPETSLSDLPPDSTAATGQKFLEPRRTDESLRVLLVGAGSSHHFPRDFIATDRATLSKTGADVIGTMNLAEALDAMPKADVLVFSGNHDQWGTPEFQKALHDFADAGKGILLLHAATWSHPWKGYNERFVAGETKAHGKGDVDAERIASADHPILKGVPESFTIADESYHFRFSSKDGHTTLIENQPDGKSPDRHPALWIVNDPKARIVAYTHGHDDKSHANPNYQTIITNAVQWVSGK